MTRLYTWLVSKLGQFGAIALLVVLAIALAAGVVSWFTSGSKTQIKLGQEQGKAATASGSDAVETLGNQIGNEQAADKVTKENDDAIRNAQGADAPVAAPVRDAGIASLCRRAAYRSDPRCVQHSSSK